jgi:hypothetical protein
MADLRVSPNLLDQTRSFHNTREVKQELPSAVQKKSKFPVAEAILTTQSATVYARRKGGPVYSKSKKFSRFIERKTVIGQVFLRRVDFLGRVREREVCCPGNTDGGDEGLE